MQAATVHPSPVGRADALRGALLALPALLLTSPLPGLLRHVPTTDSAAAGWLLLLLLPAIGLTVAVARTSWRAFGLVPAALLVLAIATEVRSGSQDLDTFEAGRATTMAWVHVAAALVAQRLGPEGRRAFVLGLASLPLVGVAAALWERSPAGVLGNPADVAAAIAPGAACALWLFASSQGASRLFAASSLAAFLAWTVQSGSRAALLATLVCTAAAVIASLIRKERQRTARIALVASLVVTAGIAALGWAPDGFAEGGLRFRTLAWSTAPAMVEAHPLGVGPGQFAREYPPFRDQEELALSEHFRAEPTPVDVEHLHNDALHAVTEQGLVLGGLFVALLLLAWFRAGRALLTPTGVDAALGLGLLASLSTGLVDCTWTQGVASPAVGLALLGSLAARPGGHARSRRLGPDGVVLAVLLAATPTARSLVDHGRALSRLAEAAVPVALEDGTSVETLDPARAIPAVEAALSAAPDSVQALSRRERLGDLSTPERRALLERILELRPHRRAELMNLANLEASEGNLERARSLQERMRVLDPRSPLLARNSLLLALDRRDAEAVEVATALALETAAVTAKDLQLLLDRQLLLGGRTWSGPLAKVVDPPVALTSGEQLFRQADLASPTGPTRHGLALRTAAHQAFAEEALERGDLPGAVRSLRQALRASAQGLEELGQPLPEGAALLRLILAGCHALGGNEAAAWEELDGLEPTARDLTVLPDAAAAALLELGLLRESR